MERVSWVENWVTRYVPSLYALLVCGQILSLDSCLLNARTAHRANNLGISLLRTSYRTGRWYQGASLTSGPCQRHSLEVIIFSPEPRCKHFRMCTPDMYILYVKFEVQNALDHQSLTVPCNLSCQIGTDVNTSCSIDKEWYQTMSTVVYSVQYLWQNGASVSFRWSFIICIIYCCRGVNTSWLSVPVKCRNNN